MSRRHWPEYVAEAVGLGLFMVSAAGFAVLLEHPDSSVRLMVESPIWRRALMGLAMGSTAVILIYWPPGARSGAHINPATTLTFFRLGRIDAVDASAYALAQFVGGILGILTASRLFAPWIGSPAVAYVSTVPGAWGTAPAFAAEVLITFVLMSVVLYVSNDRRSSRFTGLAVGVLVATYITLEAPISGMSMNPARSLGPAILAGTLDSLWIYFVAPPIGMLLAAEAYVRRLGIERVFCAKLYHGAASRCIFRCRFEEM